MCKRFSTHFDNFCLHLFFFKEITTSNCFFSLTTNSIVRHIYMTNRCLQIWSEAIQQAFFSLSVGLCPIIVLSSYNKFSHDIYRWVSFKMYSFCFECTSFHHVHYSHLANYKFREAVSFLLLNQLFRFPVNIVAGISIVFSMHFPLSWACK